MDENVRVFHFAGHLVGVGDKIKRRVTAIKLHAFDNVEFCSQTLGFLNGDYTFVADAFHSFGNHIADFSVADCRNGAHLGNFGARRNLLRCFFSLATTSVTAISIPRWRSIGFIPAATALLPSRTMACAKTVAVVVQTPEL